MKPGGTTMARRNHTHSKTLFDNALANIPGGVNSPVRAFRAVETTPIFFRRGERAWLFDVDGNRYIDYVGSWGPLILGHCQPDVVEAVQAAAARGTSFGAPSEMEITLARRLREAMPSLDLVRVVNSGTEAVMSALRLARGFTGRDKIVKFAGGYHGHADSLLVKAGSGAMTFGVPDSAGVPEALARLTLTTAYNDLPAFRELMKREGREVAAVIVEPVAANMGVVPPAPGFLEGLREVATANGSLLIFDEVITGFRVAPGGAQQLYGITPDLTCLGKVIGGGLPVGAYGGRREIMEMVAPLGPVYQAGTLAGNPLAMAAGATTLELLKAPGIYEGLEERTHQLAQGLLDLAQKHRLPVTLNRVGSIFTLFFTPGPVTDFASAKRADIRRYGRFFREMLQGGVYLAPSQFEAGFMSLAHTPTDIQDTLKIAQEAFKAMAA